jgi:hypothetical protein
MWLAILTFAVGVLVGYKYPQQVESTLTAAKKLYNDLKDKLTKKETPPPQS